MNGKKFKLKSGNKTSFKDMGSSPAKQKDSVIIEGKTYPKGYTKKDVEFLKKQHEDVVRYEDLDEKGKAIWNKRMQDVVKKKGMHKPKKKKSPLKQDRPVEVFEKKGDRIKEPKKPKARKTYQQRKEELLNQGFTQEDADQMIKSGAVTGRVDPKSKKK